MKTVAVLFVVVLAWLSFVSYFSYTDKKSIPIVSYRDSLYLRELNDSINLINKKIKQLDSINVLFYRKNINLQNSIKNINYEIEIVKNSIPDLSDSGLDSLILSVQ